MVLNLAGLRFKWRRLGLKGQAGCQENHRWLPSQLVRRPHLLSANDSRTSFHPPLGSGPGYESSAETARPFDERVKCEKAVTGTTLSAAWGWRDHAGERLRVTPGRDGSDDDVNHACVFSPSRLGRTLPPPIVLFLVRPRRSLCNQENC